MTVATRLENGRSNGHAVPQATTTRTKLTPTLAKQLLARNKNNRHVSRRAVDRYVRAMKAGEWKYNGESIKIATDNSLLDGQHRLMACVESGVTFETLVVTNLPPSVFSCIDIGRMRSGGDALDMSGFKYYRSMASAINLLEGIKAGFGIFSGGKYCLSNSELVAVVGEYSGLEDACAFASSHGVKGMIPNALLCALVYSFRAVNPEMADEFFLRLADGIGLQKSSPIRVLREKLIANMGSKMKMERRTIGAITIKAWNAYVAGKPVVKLFYGADETFPAIAK